MLKRSDLVIDGIIELVSSGDLAPGDRLPIEKELSEKLGVSRGTLREGVRALSAMGVLEVRQGSGTYVTALDLSRILVPVTTVIDLQTAHHSADLQQVRKVLEMESAFLAATRMTAEQLAEAEAILASVESLTDAQGSPTAREQFLDADLRFHSLIASASGNPLLESLLTAVSGRTARTRLWRAVLQENVQQHTHNEHRAILRALQRRDPDGARLFMGAHIHAVADFVADLET
ncbi:FadR/GntR family transcriptional regulator [Brachybacterium paraconglomeratum]|uniref:FadR/GntR family transcriptional regulator n=1 Tax=Brachybacterium paraconglomeratum TaxID=173362 RepID=UPI0031EEEA07